MANFFSNTKIYPTKWELSSSRKFNEEELNMIEKAEVVQSEYGLSVCFHLKSGNSYVPLSTDSNGKVGDIINPSEVNILTLTRGEKTIYKIKF